MTKVSLFHAEAVRCLEHDNDKLQVDQCAVREVITVNSRLNASQLCIVFAERNNVFASVIKIKTTTVFAPPQQARFAAGVIRTNGAAR
ncbi:hypothetical protein L596_003154 [Steinernema carpocapsae]|uniref:Uncharacterized protein n=1 Tax=Steinernema carpocapsae TaxID=34508 RepID=A0A4U8URU2_STECR|nr:hypothetical protein L596_003154 [Steinernema carpocapsae]